MALDKRLAEECADWIAEQLTEDVGGFIAAELIDLVMAREVELRVAHDDPEMSHLVMAERLLPMLAAEGVAVKPGAVSRELLVEILHWEDDFLGFAGQPRKIRP